MNFAQGISQEGTAVRKAKRHGMRGAAELAVRN
ncbi:uncharacterized protein BN578_01422 [[Clostridium] leptum CAG:27]|uniref:Uncharacterized protein n=1 Tax=[Clostridium] leptum CAG:27 TaxID=1263068 RepID=R6MX60_9FIRM|nr:uncharacterized protein BN578_01422 [[Clostridium] leptum CAG:27]